MTEGEVSSTWDVPASGCTLYALEPGYCIAGWSNVLINCVRETASVPMLRVTQAAHDDIFSRHPAGVGVLTTMGQLPQLPDANTRQLAAESIRRSAGQVLGQVSVIAVEGFLGSAVRSAMAAINMLARAPNPTKVSSSDEDAVQWLAVHAAIGDPCAWTVGLSGAIGESRTRLEQKFPEQLAAT